MESAFSWIGEIFSFLLSLLPRLLMVRATHNGVKFRNGKTPILLEPGLHFFWPLVTEVIIYPIVRQTVNLDSQTLSTTDGKIVGVSGILVYEICDSLKFLTKTYDGEDTIRDIALTAVSTVISTNSFSFLHENIAKVNSRLSRRLSTKLDRFGVKVVKVSLSDFFPCDLVIANWGVAEGRYSGSAQ